MDNPASLHDPIGWFPVLALILGYVLKVASDWIQDRRTFRRERSARRVSFQRQTLLDLQEAIMKLLRATGAIHHQDVMNCRSGGQWQKTLVSEEWSDKFALANAQTTMLSVRVLDERVRELVSRVKSSASSAGMSRNETESNEHMALLQASFEVLNERVGEVMRTLDEA